MGKFRFYTLFFFSILCSITSKVFAQQLGITPIQVDTKLPSHIVNRIFQDSDGYIWFATANGISRFDGYRTATFNLEDQFPQAINSDNILSLNEIPGYLLIGTENGLYLLNKETYRTSVFPDKNLKNRKINQIVIDKESRIWVGTEGPLYIYNENLSIRKSYRHDARNRNTIPEGAANSIYEDKAGNLWVCFWNGGLHRFDEKNNRFLKYPKIGTKDNPFKIIQDNKNQYWICTWGDGLYLFDPNDKDHPYDEIIIKNKRRTDEKEAIVFNIVQDNNEKYLWVLSFSGISTLRYLPDGSIKEINLSHLFENTTNIFSDIYKDKRGILWLTVFGEGISAINFNKPEVKNYSLYAIKERFRLSPNPTMLYEDTDGDIWFNQDRLGLALLDRKIDKISVYSDYTALKNLVSLRSVSCAIELNGTVWVGSSHLPVINVFKKDKGKITLQNTVNLEQFAPNAGTPLTFLKDHENNLWIATTNGVLKKSAGKNEFIQVKSPEGYISGVTQDANGDIWIATKSNGIFGFRNGKISQPIHLGKASKGLGTNNIEAIDTDDYGNLWIGTRDNRLISYQTLKNKFNEFARSHTLYNEQILNVACLDGHIWISTPRHIFRLNPDDKTILEYSGEDGLNVNIFMKNAYFTSAMSNEIYLGGNRGISVLKSSNTVSRERHKVVISDVKINNRSVMENNHRKDYNLRSLKLTLNPEDKNIEIDFSALEYVHPNKIKYVYKLEGVDKDWVYASRDRPFATYNNLSKGRYKFLIKATNVNNIWSDDLTEFSIYKTPAFYESNLAYLLYLSCILALAYYIIQFALFKLKSRGDLRIAQIEKEKSDELIQTKLKYFTNISHDLLTPITIISCLIDDVEITNNKHLPQFDKMRSNLNRLKRLLQQILDFRKIESGNMQLRISKGNIVKFIEEICTNYFSPLVKKKQIAFSISHNTSEPNAYFDADKIDKIIFNLLSNAFKYTSPGGKIEVGLDINKKAERTFLIIKIEDNGIGIAPEEADKIFIQFYNNKNSGKNQSNGIGLALTKDLIELHHGSIKVESEPNNGASFFIQIPIDKESYTSAELESVNEIIFTEETSTEFPFELVHPDIAVGPTERLSLLLVEDNEDLQLTVKNILSKNYRVHTASNGKEALDVVDKNEIDIIISDVIMPEMDGLEFCRSLKANVENSHIPIILLTAKSDVNDRVDCYNAGADGYISKPFELKVLEARINSFILNKRTKQIVFKTSPEINISKLEYPTLDEQFLDQAIKIIEEHLSNSDFEVILLAAKLNMSKSTLYRKIKTLLNLSPSELIKNIRLKHACQIMDKDKSISVTEVAFATGFSDPRYFSTCFKAEFGITPTEYQKQQVSKVRH